MPFAPPRRILPLLLALATVAAIAPRGEAQIADSAVVAEARAFMESYAHDLRTADRPAIAARYDRRGVYIVFNGDRRSVSWEDLRARYASGWVPPVAFEFRDLVFEPAGADAVVVNGDFYWTEAAGTMPERYSYTALLLRQEGRLHIRMEVEAMHPASASLPATP